VCHVNVGEYGSEYILESVLFKMTGPFFGGLSHKNWNARS